MLKGLRSVIVFVRDTEVSRQWYEKVGFAYVRGYDGMHWFRVGDSEIMLHPAGTGSSSGGHNIHLNAADVDQLFAYVTEQGLEPRDHQQPGKVLTEPVTRPWGDREFELYDPDGHVWAFNQA